MRKLKETMLLGDNVERVLEYFNYYKIKRVSKNEVRCAIDSDGNPTAIRIRLNENLSSTDFVRNINGDIITLIMSNRNLKFKEVINGIKEVLGLSDFQYHKSDVTFLTIFKSIDKKKEISKKIELDVYPEQILDDYSKQWNMKFLNDNISIDVQKEFGIGFDDETQRITIPWRDFEGEICGIMGRSNIDNVENKYLPIIPFKKSGTLYGFSENYLELCDNNIFIGESEKFVLQLKTMGYSNAVALGGDSLSDVQIKELLTLNPKNLIFCYDEGLNPKVINGNFEKIKRHLAFKNIGIYLIYDKNNKYLKNKCSPSDLGKEIWEKVKRECVLKIKI